MTLTVGRAIIDNSDFELTKAQKKIKELEKLFAEEIQKVADLLKENSKLETEMEKIRQQRDCWKKLYRKIRPDEKVTCDRQKAMVVYGEIDMDGLVGGKVDN